MGTIPQLSILKGPARSIQPALIDKLFEDVARGEAAKKTALIYKENGITNEHTYEELNERSNKLARIICQSIKLNNLPKNSDGDYIIAVHLPATEELVIVLLAIWKAGGAYLPMDMAFPTPRIEHIIREARPAIVIYERDADCYLDTYKLQTKDLFKKSENQSPENLKENEKVHHTRDDLAIVLYTSGSTGVPKGVRLPHKVILNRLQWQFKRFPYSSTETTCVFKTALTFVDSVPEIWGPLINGLTILVVPKMVTQDPEALVDLLEEYKVERIVVVPSLLRAVLMYLELQKPLKKLENLKMWVCSGEPLSISLAEEFYKYFPERDYCLCNFYGSTEIMGDVTYYILPGLKELSNIDKVPIGLPLDNTVIYLFDKDFRLVQAGDVGELFVSGLNLAAGYVNGRDPEKFLDNPLAIDPSYERIYRTGDFAKIEGGVLIYEGRTDSQVKIRGHRVDLSEVEKAVNNLEVVEKGVVLCYKPGESNQALLAFVLAKNHISENQIEAILKTKLAPYMVPQVIIIESIPLLVNGKVDRQTLLKSYENRNCYDKTKQTAKISYEGVPTSQMSAAKDLFETVASVLGRSARSVININANFYEIGGNSLNSIYTVSQLKSKGYNLAIGDFLSAVDLGEVLLRMQSDTPMNTAPPVYTSEMLKNGHKNVVTDMVTTSFYQKADLEQWIIAEINEDDYIELITALWEPLIEKDLSFIVKTDTGKIVGVALNFDARDEPEIEIKSRLTVIFEFLETIESSVRDTQLPLGKRQIMHSFMMATHSSLTAKENVAVMQYMEDEVLKLAERKGFTGIFTTNTSPVTQQLGTDVHNYQTLLDYQVNQYVASDNTKPFGIAPDNQRALVQWKPIR